MTDNQEWAGKRVTVVGLGIEGEDLARYFASHGAKVTVSATRAAQERLDALAEFDITFLIGSNEASHADGADLVAVTQGAPQGLPPIKAARERGVPVESMMTLFLDRWRGPTCGITGSSGKTTTTSLVDAIFTASERQHILGGNIGRGLLTFLDTQPDGEHDTWAVLEMSHTQLVTTRSSPDVAAVLNVTPNHLDQFSWEDYVGLKRKIYSFQDASGHVVFNADDPVSQQLRPEAKARVFLFGMNGDHGTDGAFVADGAVYWRLDGRTERAVAVAEIPMRGAHNVANVAAATAIASACGIGPEAVGAAVRSFTPPAHRIELVGRRVNGVAYYNDSIATAPERTLAALRSFEEPIVLLLGGRDKNLPLDELMAEARERCRAVVCFGESGPLLAAAAESAGIAVTTVTTLPEAVGAAHAAAQAGDVVLLSPACTSFDAYPNFEARGAEFRELVSRLPQGARS